VRALKPPSRKKNAARTLQEAVVKEAAAVAFDPADLAPITLVESLNQAS